MRVSQFFEALPHEYYGWGSIFCYPRNAEPYCQIVDRMRSMTTPSTMLMLNTAVSFMDPGECYLEVGTWRGATFIGALQGNEGIHGYAIDDDSWNSHDEEARPSSVVWWDNVKHFGLANRAHYINDSVPAAWKHGKALTEHKPIGVYLFDGDKSTSAAAYDGLEGVLPLLADEALIILDDANQVQIRLAAMELIRRYPYQTVTLMDMPTPGNCWPGFWDGFLIIGFTRR